ncbi:uncharacterized protein BDZ99DRAFT_573903 [Mytilinidion resinicola]|uniref:Mid2 domain-containing protein n=1 Tax=Mytilinidion resinicola TaxID=574789 RepID=A0A6A6YCT1_9PEZI|nr:uncharacterized protein BDZ99DRAFT_573903 [Mytilinidion resinicola]KAF2806378.1 hypothetical protein BDZ99DRAFT_573903 [Mytilinidion resinicola]
MLRARSSATSAVTSFLLFLLFFPSLIESTCFNPNGTTSTDLPCDPNNDSVCCSEGFYCLSNGLCQDPRYTNPLRLLRGACNDKGWGSCPSFCKSEYPGGDEAVNYCGNGKYCCSSQNCCDDPNTTFLTLGDPSVYATAMQGGDPNIKTTATAQQPQSATAQAASASSNPPNPAQLSASSPTSPASNPSNTDSAAANPTASPQTTPKSSASASYTGPFLATITLAGTTITTTLSTPPSSSAPSTSPSTSTHTYTTAIAVGASIGGTALLLGLLGLGVFLRRRARARKGRALVEMDSGGARNEFEGSEGVWAWMRGKRGDEKEIGGAPVFEMKEREGEGRQGRGGEKEKGKESGRLIGRLDSH